MNIISGGQMLCSLFLSVWTDATFRFKLGFVLLPWINPGASPNDSKRSMACVSSSFRCARNRIDLPLLMAEAIIDETMVVFPPPVGTHRIDRLCLAILALSRSMASFWYGLNFCIKRNPRNRRSESPTSRGWFPVRKYFESALTRIFFTNVTIRRK